MTSVNQKCLDKICFSDKLELWIYSDLLIRVFMALRKQQHKWNGSFHPVDPWNSCHLKQFRARLKKNKNNLSMASATKKQRPAEQKETGGAALLYRRSLHFAVGWAEHDSTCSSLIYFSSASSLVPNWCSRPISIQASAACVYRNWKFDKMI